jgi:hypothetical protein
MNTIASANVVTAPSQRMTQAAPTNPIAAALTPFKEDLNHFTCRKRAQKGTIPKMSMTPGPNKPK